MALVPRKGRRFSDTIPWPIKLICGGSVRADETCVLGLVDGKLGIGSDAGKAVNADGQTVLVSMESRS